MKVAVLHGTARHGTTWKLTQLFLDGLPQGTEVAEFAFPRDMDTVCAGCVRCIVGSEMDCPHAALVEPIRKTLLEADVVVASSPVYVMGMTAGLKVFFEHMAYWWLVHRPEPAMGKKVAVAISTAAGPCTGTVLKDLKQQFFYWGIPKTLTWGEAVGGGWDYLTPLQKTALECKAARLAQRASARVGRVKPTLKLRLVGAIMGHVGQKEISHEAEA